MTNKNQRVGILTFHRTTNFGSVLQTYGLYKIIQNLGYDPEIIDYRCPAIERREQIQRSKRALSLKGMAKEIFFQPTITKKKNELLSFVSDNMRMSIPYYPDTIKEAAQHYDKIIVGSDIVWGMDITEGDKTYFLDFVDDNSKKYAFASSVGHREVKENEMEITSLLSEFSQLAVREEDSAAWVNALIGIQPTVVCDPTMLLTIEEWEKAISPKCVADNYVLVYFDNDNHKCSHDAYEYAKKKGLIPYYINYGRSRDGLRSIRPTNLNEFLGLIKHADMVFTSSYHGFLFSLFFHKQFVFYTRAHKSRVLALQNRLQLDRCGDDSLKCLNKKIDYITIDKRIMELRESSTGILKGMLD